MNDAINHTPNVRMILRKKPVFKVIVLSLVLFAAFIGLFDHVSRQHVKVIESQRLDQMKQLVEIARNAIEPIAAGCRSGDISREAGIAEVRNLVRRMTFTESHGDNYVFMSAYDGTMLVQPFEPDKEMTNQWDLKDSHGVYIIRELVKTAENKPEGGFVRYFYMPPGSGAPQEKISFVMGVQELECYIGVGRYMEDLRKEQADFRWKTFILETMLVLLLLALCLMAVSEIVVKNRLLVKEVHIRQDSEKELRALKNYLGDIINSMPSVLIGVDGKGKVTQWNQHAEKVTGVKEEEAAGRDLKKVYPADSALWEKISDSIHNREIVQHRKKITRGNNLFEYEDFTIYPLISEGMEGAVIRVDNVTSKVQMEELVVQSEKMLSVGGLAAGMAHEINNPLAGMMQMAEVMSTRLTGKDVPANRQAAERAGTTMEAIHQFMEDRGIPKMIETIQSSGVRAAKIVENMLSFARKGSAQTTHEDLAELLDSTLELALTDYDLKKKHDFRSIKIVKEYEPGIPPVPCDRPQIQQVLLNVLQNAAYAMQAASGSGKQPKIILRLKRQGGMACVEIQDNGPGMEETVCKRIFEPFFTTKPTGIGTGLGLSVSYFIVTEAHQGRMEVSSHPGLGARFTIRLPLSVM
ncbi:PAS domain S-box-containing protein [Desulfatibacillum alkenivorans DSM 16219]|jgi:PAS domain S-box-containing protein|uniref:histidine kinase n=1 Tax=Desulfatibacillum alkenivorans DSM 16219 TaxID=1121393 RepID=A0A1M6TRF3_9BACT|nr:cache domain-containing protein [Desulfatibacillum alkenivorans]SHK59500.1 PAS domain S-box-containing protein [Desulfatibacillum alkenivorans DSM 16219]